MPLSRRQFLQQSAVAGALVAHAPAALARRPSARRSDDVRVGVVGLNGRGKDHIDAYLRIPGVRIVALCDCDAEVLAREMKRLDERGHPAQGFADFRKLLDREDLDAVSIASPNHWHALMSVWACQAGKDVYLEKPVSHTIWEGRQAVRAARRYNRVVQAGTQARSSTAIADAIAWMRAGNLGKVTLARGLCYKPRRSIGKADGTQQLPAGLDYDLWCGPTSVRPLARKKLHYDWHWDYRTGNADLGNQGIHQVDICRWALDEGRLPTGVLSVGARVGYQDDGGTPNTHLIHFAYATPMIFEVRGLPRDAAAREQKWEESMDAYRGVSIGVVIECEGGDLVVTSDYSKAKAIDRGGSTVKEWKGTGDHFANFIDVVRSRDHSRLAADIEQGHVSSALCHLGNTSHRMGAAADRAAIEAAFAGVPGGSEALARLLSHLDANAIDLAAAPLTLGPALVVDPTSEKFVGNEKADRFVRRNDRPPFVVPAID
jgi:predicted dehydrogenase